MKNLHFISVLFLSMFISSCSSDDTTDAPTEGPKFQASLNGGTFSNYNFKLGAYEATKGTNGNTLSINIADPSGTAINLFLNNTDGFKTGTVKQIGNIDSDNFVTHGVIRDVKPAVSYFSKTGTIKITNNREHPTNSQQRLISGEFNIVASSIDGTNTTTIKGSFEELAYNN